MDNTIAKYTQRLVKVEKPSFKNVGELINEIGFHPPADYIEFMQIFGACEGEIGENSWLALWSLDELQEINSIVDIVKDNPDLFIFGKDAAEIAYVFNKENGFIFEIGFLDSRETDKERFIGCTFKEFLEYLYTS